MGDHLEPADAPVAITPTRTATPRRVRGSGRPQAAATDRLKIDDPLYRHDTHVRDAGVAPELRGKRAPRTIALASESAAGGRALWRRSGRPSPGLSRARPVVAGAISSVPVRDLRLARSGAPVNFSRRPALVIARYFRSAGEEQSGDRRGGLLRFVQLESAADVDYHFSIDPSK